MASKWRNVDQVEDAVSRAILRTTKLGTPGILRQAGQSAAGKLTISMLRDFADFPAKLYFTDSPPELIDKMLKRFHKTALYASWIRTWEENPEVPAGRRRLATTGIGWGHVVLSDGGPPECGHISLPVPGGRTLHLVLLRSWVDSLGWSEVADKDSDE